MNGKTYRIARGFAWAALLGALSSCSLSRGTKQAPKGESSLSQRQGYSLLYQVVSKNRHAGKLLWVKAESDALEKAMDTVVELCAQATETIEAIAEEKGFALDANGLPPVEVKTREEIESTSTGELLRASGRTFEVRLLLTQLEATRYAAHLSRVLKAEEPDASTAERLGDLSRRFEEVREEILEVLVTQTSDGNV